MKEILTTAFTAGFTNGAVEDFYKAEGFAAAAKAMVEIGVDSAAAASHARNTGNTLAQAVISSGTSIF